MHLTNFINFRAHKCVSDGCAFAQTERRIIDRIGAFNLNVRVRSIKSGELYGRFQCFFFHHVDSLYYISYQRSVMKITH